jgi:hemerythrin-like metal-binding protein
MPLLGWRPEYSVHDDELDSHHQKLFCLLNKVYENIMNSLEVNSVIPLIDELTEYTRSHFTAEEKHMRDKGFQELDEHILKHSEFTRKIVSMRTHFHGNNLEVTQELLIVLGDWLLHHVLVEDRKHSL